MGHIYTNGTAGGISIMEKEDKFYAVVIDRKLGLIIIEITDPYKPEVLKESINYIIASDLIIVKIETKIYVVTS